MEEVPTFMRIAKEGNICLFFEKKMEVYAVTEQVRKKYSKEYEIPQLESEESSYHILMVPPPFENILNVFFEEKKGKNRKVFTLWSAEYEFAGD